MKRLLLLPYLITSLVVYTASVGQRIQAWDQTLDGDPTLVLAVWWCLITITGLVVALSSEEW